MKRATAQSAITLLGMIFALFTSQLIMAQAAVSTEEMEKLRAKLSLSLEVASQNQLQISAMTATELANVIEVELNTGEMLYTDISGSYIFAGDMFQVSPAGLVNISASKRQIRIQEKVAAIPSEELIIFTPDQTKATITVFTDVDCTYCRALHRDIEKLLELGIQVRYAAYPRGGEQATSFSKMISVWCSDDRARALTQAKNGQNLPEKNCNTPVLQHYAIGNEIGITGTPALVFPDGKVVPGYNAEGGAEWLAQLLNINN